MKWSKRPDVSARETHYFPSLCVHLEWAIVAGDDGGDERKRMVIEVSLAPQVRLADRASSYTSGRFPAIFSSSVALPFFVCCNGLSSLPSFVPLLFH